MKLTLDKESCERVFGSCDEKSFTEDNNGCMVSSDAELITKYCLQNNIEITRPVSSLNCFYAYLINRTREI